MGESRSEFRKRDAPGPAGRRCEIQPRSREAKARRVETATAETRQTATEQAGGSAEGQGEAKPTRGEAKVRLIQAAGQAATGEGTEVPAGFQAPGPEIRSTA